MMSDPGHAAIVRSIIDLGHNLDLRVVAEGVETEDVAHELRRAGCDTAQGFLFARPMPLGDLRDWVIGYARSRPAAVR
jgi:EAL domain-containing protein (putative c-di-GMP-specific phosphodiesterase class I)